MKSATTKFASGCTVRFAHCAMRTPYRAFTLIELLVVVAIIAVLLALLTPALDRAIYNAELAVCSSRLHLIATGAINYTFEHKKWYPYRPSRTSNGSNRPTDLYWGQNEKRDDRTILKTFLSLNAALNDPLVRAVDVEGSKADSRCFVPYALYFGWGYDKADLGDQIMRRLGDRWTYTTTGSGPSIVDSFSVLASDWDGIIETQERMQSTHPDRDGILSNFTIQDELFNGTVPPHQTTLTVWRNEGQTTRRGVIDTNYAYSDGSVERFNDVPWDAAGGTGTDQRLMRVHHADDRKANADTRIRVPRR